MKTYPLFVHGNCTQWMQEKSFLDCSKRSFFCMAVQHSQEGLLQQRRKKHYFLIPQYAMDRKDAAGGRRGGGGGGGGGGGVQKSASGHETMSKAKSSEQHLDISHSSIFFNLNVGSSSNNMDIPDRTLSSIFFESDGEPDDEYRTYRGLVLDLSYRPINVVCWKRALCLQIMEKADVLEYYDQAVKATNQDYFIPAVLRVSSFVYTPKQKKVRLNLTRRNVLFRDKFKCQYCGAREDLTMDHVLAASRGGKWEWENLVTACSSCNVKKGDKTLEEAHMKLLKPPREPKELDSIDIPHGSLNTYRRLGQRRSPPPTQWLDYLPKRTSFF